MPNIAELTERYFLRPGDLAAVRRVDEQPGDTTHHGEHVPSVTEGNDVLYLIDGEDYFGKIYEELIPPTAPSGTHPFFYFTDWFLELGGGFTLRREGVPLSEQLQTMSSAGVDVRALVWVSLPIMAAPSPEGELARHFVHDIATFNRISLESVVNLRVNPSLRSRVLLNLLAHPAGGIHLKLVLSGDDSHVRAFVGGLDFSSSRNCNRRHTRGGESNLGKWHDAGVRIDGPAAAEIYHHFESLWNEQISQGVTTFRIAGVDHPIPSHFVGQALPNENSPPMADRTWPIPQRPTDGSPWTRTKRIQLLRTLPQMRFGAQARNTPLRPSSFAFFGSMNSLHRPPLQTAPTGLFEFMPALHKAISNAQKYIYIEDQAFSSFDVMQWIQNALRENPTLKAIFVYGRDPQDPPNPGTPEASRRYLFGLDPGRPVVPQTWWSNIAFYERREIIIHSKVTIIDDVWVAIGSANCMRRSLYTDAELSVGIIDEPDAASPSEGLCTVADFRCSLWAEHCNEYDQPEGDTLLPENMRNIDHALALWSPPGTVRSGMGVWPGMPPGTLRTSFRRFDNPPDLPRVPFNRFEYDTKDPDSTQLF